MKTGQIPLFDFKPAEPLKSQKRWAYHEFEGFVISDFSECTKCGLPKNRHRKADTRQRIGRKRKAIATPKRPVHDNRKRTGRKQKKEYDGTIEWIGIDGEGQGRDIHKYVFLAASTEDRKRRWYVENQNGLTSQQVLAFMLSLPTYHARIFAYSFNYDLTKALENLPDEKLYKIFRPEIRPWPGGDTMKGPKPVRWNYFSINMQGTKFSVGKTGMKRRIIWDIWKFFQSKFVDALEEWEVGDPKVLENMRYMKDHRHEFDKIPFDQVREYCFDECAYMATLARKLWEAHNTAGLRLKNFFGAGSSASAMLAKMEIKEKIVPTPKEMQEAVAKAYFGGRFENSVLGEIEGPIHNYDISSAYPYQTYFLPCLQHARWVHTDNRLDIEDCTHALVHYGLPNTSISQRSKSWGPFPYRTSDGSICFPASSGGGWVWRDEYRWGEKLFGNVQFKEAWVLHSDCDCHPFKDIPNYYLERLKIGKEGPGIVLKLGINSCYGKIAQSVGKGQFNSWIWAGMITSGCRAQLLELLSLHKNRANCLMMATDGIYSRELLVTPKARDTGTDIEVIERKTGKKVRKPLGGWEHKRIDWPKDDDGKSVIPDGQPLARGVFVARPGIYFPLYPSDKEIKVIRARGVGKASLLANWQIIVDSWKRYGTSKTVPVANISRFCGAKTSITRSGKPGAYEYKRAARPPAPEMLPGFELSEAEEKKRLKMPAFGQWISRQVAMSFDPMPKRNGVNDDGTTLTIRRLGEKLPPTYGKRGKLIKPRHTELDPKVESLAYPKAVKKFAVESLDAIMMANLRQEMLEQPDIDLADYELDDTRGDF